MSFGKCETTTKDPILVFHENRSSLIINNPLRVQVRKIKVDDCVITVGRRCDYFVIGPRQTEYFIELKGCDINHAVSQLEETIKKLGTPSNKISRFAIVISSRCPLSTPQIQKHQYYFKIHLNAILLIRNRLFEINL